MKIKKSFIALLALASVSIPVLADIKISQLPLGSGAAVGANDSFPYVDATANVTKRLKLDDLVNIPIFGSSFATTASPTFTGVVTAPTFAGALTGNSSTATALASSPATCTGLQFATGIGPSGNAICSTPAGSGTVTSVGLTVPSWLSVTGSPVTSSGVIAVTGASQSANLFLASPNGGSGVLSPRAIVAADVPTLNQNTTGNAATVTTNANLTGPITSTGNATSVAAQTGTGSTFVMNTSPTLVTPNLGTPSALVATNATGTAAGLTAGNVTTNANLTGPITSTGNATAVASQTGTGSTFVMNTSPTLVTPALGTPTALVGTNITGTAAGLTAGSVTTNANLTGPITSTGNATAIASQTGTGTKFVMDTSPTLVTPNLGTPSALVATNATGTAAGLTAGGNLQATPTNHGVLISGSGNTASVTSAGTSLQVLTSNGPSADPTFQTAPVSTTLTTKGDFQTFSTVNARQPVPGDYGLLVPDSAQTTGWRNATYTTRSRGYTEKNYIQYNDFENGAATGWSLGHVTLTNGIPTGTPTFGSGASGNLSISASATTPIAGGFSGVLASSAATTVGDFVATSALPIDIAGSAKVMQFKATYAVSNGGNGNFSGTSSNTYGYAVYDVTNSAWLSCVGQFNFVSNAVVGTSSAVASGTCQTNLTTSSVRVVVYNVAASTGTITLQLDDAYFGPQITAAGVAASDPVSFTPTFSAGFGSVTSITAKYTRIANRAKVDVTFRTGAVTTGSGTITLPSPLVLDSTAVDQVNGYLAGKITSNGTTTGGAQNGAYLAFLNSGNVLTVVSNGAGAGLVATTNVNSTYNSTTFHSFTAEFPVAGWSSQTAMSNDTDTREISAIVTGAPANMSGGAPIIFPTVTKDTSASYSATTGIYTVPVTGTYDVAAFVTATHAAGDLLQVFKNGSLFRSIGTQQTANAANYGTIAVPCVAGDTLYVTNNNAMTAFSATTTNQSASFIRRSGPATIAASESVNAKYTGATTAIGALATVVNPTKVYDSHNAYNASTGVYTVPISGKYEVKGNLKSSASVSNPSGGNVTFQVNQTGSATVTQLLDMRTFYATISAVVFAGGSTTLICLAGDTIFVNSSSNASFNGSGDVSTNLSISRVGN